METDDLTPTTPAFDAKGWVADVNDELTGFNERLEQQDKKVKLAMVGLAVCAAGVAACTRVTMQVLKMVQEINGTLKVLSAIPGQAVAEAKAQEPIVMTPVVNIDDGKAVRTVDDEIKLPPMRELSDEEKADLAKVNPAAVIKEPPPSQ